MYLMYIYRWHAIHASSVPAQVIACMCMYVYVYVCICMYWYVSACITSICACIACIGIHVHTCVYMYTYVGHIQATYTLLCVGAHNRPETFPGGGGQPAGPTQDSPGQQPCHFIPRSGTHSHTRFGAPVGAARVGGGQSRPPALPMGHPITMGTR